MYSVYSTEEFSDFRCCRRRRRCCRVRRRIGGRCQEASQLHRRVGRLRIARVGPRPRPASRAGIPQPLGQSWKRKTN